MFDVIPSKTSLNSLMAFNSSETLTKCSQSPSVSAIGNLNFERSRYSRPSRGILHFLQLCEFYERICHRDGHYSLASKGMRPFSDCHIALSYVCRINRHLSSKSF